MKTTIACHAPLHGSKNDISLDAPGEHLKTAELNFDPLKQKHQQHPFIIYLYYYLNSLSERKG